MKRALIVAILAGVISLPASAAISKDFVEWGRGPVQFLMTQEEADTWKSIVTDDEARAFKSWFWGRRDATPLTPENYAQDEFDARVTYADKKFAEGSVRGAMTDRGRVLIIMGPPSYVQRSSSQPRKHVSTPSGANLEDPASNGTPGGYVPGNTFPGAAGNIMADGLMNMRDSDLQNGAIQIWKYDPGKSKTPLYAPIVEFGFVEQPASQWKLERTSRTDYIGAFSYANRKAIAQPELELKPATRGIW